MTGLRWSRRTTRIAEELLPLGISVSPTPSRLLDQMGYSLCLNHKQISTNSSPNRNLQFEYLAELRGRFQRRHLPIISFDTKKRELVGNFNYTLSEIARFDDHGLWSHEAATAPF